MPADIKYKSIEDIQNIVDTDRTVVICMRGLPGSGKSTIVQDLRRKLFKSVFYHVSCVSADDYHINKDNVYDFKMENIAAAHKYCYKKFLSWILEFELIDYKGYSRAIIVDNTNTQKKEYAKYKSVADAMGCQFLTIVPDNPEAWDVDVLFERNVHGVPRETIERMKNRFYWRD